MWYTALYMARHNTIVACIKKASALKFEDISENQAVGSQRLRPDLVLKNGKKFFIVDVIIPFDNRLAAFQAAVTEKAKYEGIRIELATFHTAEAVVVPIIVGSLGS